MKNIILIVCSLLPVLLWGQDRSGMYPYLLTPGYVNPAANGPLTHTDVQLISRTAFGRAEGLPRTFGGMVSFPMANHSAVGGKVLADLRGPQRIFTSELNYAKGVRLAHQHMLYLGFSGGITQFSLNRQDVNAYTELPDQLIAGNLDGKLRFSAGAGLYYTLGRSLEIGLSAPALVTSGYAINQDFYGMAAYTFFFGADSLVKVKPMVWYHRTSTQQDVADLLLNVGYKDAVWVQGGYRTNQAFTIGAGAYFKWFGFGYIAHLNESSYGQAVRGMHEVQLRFRFGYGNNNKEVVPVTR